MKVEVSLSYKKENGEIVRKDVIQADCRCPACGSENVYKETGDGDYYLGAVHYCELCKQSFSVTFFQKENGLFISKIYGSE